MDESYHQVHSTPQSQAHPQHQPPLQRYSSYQGKSTSLPPINGLPPAQLNATYGHSGSVTSNPLTSHPPNTSAVSAVSTAPTFSHVPAAPPRTLHPPPSYVPASSYPTTQPPLQSAPPTFAHPSRLQDIRPRPQDGFAVPSQYGTSQLPSQPNSVPMPEPEPTHVVGSQGRRGILPSLPGRAQPGTGKNMIPVKDQDGKFPCPHCSKTYLHAKHLKRHLLRHTGDRPYQCKLCKDTFSRSDILKRHFQKCSIRRGVPGDTDHLEGSRAHLQKDRNVGGNLPDNNYFNGSNGNEAPPTFQNGAGALAANHILGGPGFIPEQPMYADGLASLSTRTSRSNSLIRPGSIKNENRRSMSSLDQLNSSRTSFEESHEFGGAGTTLGAMPPNMNAYTMPPAQHSSSQIAQNYGYGAVSGAELSSDGHVKAEDPAPMFPPSNHAVGLQNQSQDMGWSNSYQPSGQNNFMFSMNSGGNNARVMKSETDMMPSNLAMTGGTPQDALFSGLYSNTASFGENQIFDTWNLDPLEDKAQALISFCFPEGASNTEWNSDDEAKLRSILIPDNIRTYSEHFQNFQSHWPIIHMPTFNPAEASNCILLTMICIGAVYSDTMDVLQVRWLMELVRDAVQKNSRILSRVEQTPVPAAPTDPQEVSEELDEINSLVLLHCLFTWHGNQAQRAYSRSESWKLAAIARHGGLLNVFSPQSPSYSILHQPNHELTQQDIQTWDWKTWVEQEKRVRSFCLTYLFEAAMVIFFNSDPLFDISEIHVPLPADDAAWEARTAIECANALGLNGRAAQDENASGSRRMKQPDFKASLRALLDPKVDFKPCSTNIYSKFIVVHSLLIIICSAQKQASPLVSQGGVAGFSGIYTSGTATPLSQNDWVALDGSNSGPTTPDGMIQPKMQTLQQHLQKVQFALEKWKRTWDADMKIQYPSQSAIRRVGFCRDAIHYYFLGLQFIRHSRPQDWRVSPDHRFSYVMRLLKTIKNWVASEHEQRGQELGSVGDIDDAYGVEDLTLDMKLLFSPIKSQTSSPSTNPESTNNGMTGNMSGDCT